MPTTPTTITRADIRNKLIAESTNASRTMRRQDGVSEFEDVVIDEQADGSLDGAWTEACMKITEKLHEFITGSFTFNQSSFMFTFRNSAPDGAVENIKMYIVDYMMASWLASVRPDYRQQYVERANIELDDLLRKLYRKEPPV